MIHTYNSVEEAYYNTLSYVRANGLSCEPRGQKCKEIIGHSFCITSPRNRVIFNKERNINFSFMVAEWLWIMSGSNDVAMISYYNSVIANYSDDGKTMHGAYGKRINKFHQLENVIKKLEEDPDSRQAMIIIFQPSDVVQKTKDVPCTILFQFFIRDYKLHMITYMRSNDVLLGLPYDLFNFTMIQEYVSTRLNNDTSFGMGTYTHMVGSLHMYERDSDRINDVIDEYEKNSKELFGEKNTMNLMDNYNFDGLDWLIRIEKYLRNHSLDSSLLKSTEEAPNDYWKNLFYFLAMRKTKEDNSKNKMLKEIIAISDPYFKKLVT